MKKIFDFIEENCLAIFISICSFGLIVLIVLCEIQLSNKDLYELEKACYEFYQENNYILEECSKYEEKLEGVKYDKE